MCQTLRAIVSVFRIGPVFESPKESSRLSTGSGEFVRCAIVIGLSVMLGHRGVAEDSTNAVPLVDMEMRVEHRIDWDKVADLYVQRGAELDLNAVVHPNFRQEKFQAALLGLQNRPAPRSDSVQPFFREGYPIILAVSITLREDFASACWVIPAKSGGALRIPRAVPLNLGLEIELDGVRHPVLGEYLRARSLRPEILP